MYTFDVDLTAIVALWLGGALLLLPVAGLTARFALLPLLESWAGLRRAWRDEAEATARLAALEEQVHTLHAALERWEAEGCAAGTSTNHY